jgi:hypothetical protein
MRARDLEQDVFDLDEIRIIIRAPRNADVGEYDYERKAPDKTSLNEWLQQRISPLVGDHQVTVVDGYGAMPHGKRLPQVSQVG